MPTREASVDRGGAGRALYERLIARGWEFDFTRAVWLLERAMSPDRLVGGPGPVEQEGIRFRPDIGMGFPGTDVRRIDAKPRGSTDGRIHEIDVTFLGLYGVSTPLPLHYAVDILRAVAASEAAGAATPGRTWEGPAAPADTPAIRAMLDVIHHRLISLFYRACVKYRYDVLYAEAGRDEVTDYLLWLIGCPPDVGRDEVGVAPRRLIRYAGLLTQRPRSAASLEGMLRDYWKDAMPLRVDQCVGRWVTLSRTDLNVLGLRNSSLGVDLTVGEQVYDVSGSFNIVVGPVGWDEYQAFLPDGPRHAQTRSLARLFCQDPLDFTIEVKLREGEAPMASLTSDADCKRVGLTCWARTEEVAETAVRFDESSFRHCERIASSADGAALEQTLVAAQSNRRVV